METQPQTSGINPVAIANRLAAQHTQQLQEAEVMRRVDVTNPEAVSDYAVLHAKLELMEADNYQPLSFLNVDLSRSNLEVVMPSPSDILTQKIEARNANDKTKLLDLNDRTRAVDVLADSLKQHPQTYRQLMQLRTSASNEGDNDSLSAIKTALVEKLNMTREEPAQQLAAIEKLDRLYGNKKREPQISAKLPATELTSTPPPDVSNTPKPVSVTESLVSPKHVTTVKPVVEHVKPIIQQAPTIEARKNPEQLEGFVFDVGVAEKASKGEEVLVHNESTGLFAVIDGWNDLGTTDVAAQIVGDALDDHFNDLIRLGASTDESNAVTHMKNAFMSAQHRIQKAAKIGLENSSMGAALTAVKLFKGDDGRNLGVYGHAGDTQLFILGDDNVLTAVTMGEVRGNYVSNAVNTNSKLKFDQFGIFEVPEYSRLIFLPSNMEESSAQPSLDENEIFAAACLPHPQSAAEELLRISRMRNNNSALVIDVEAGADSRVYPQAVNASPVVAPMKGNEAKVIKDDADTRKDDSDKARVITDDEETVFRHFVALHGLSEAIKLMKSVSETAAPVVEAKRKPSLVPVIGKNIGRVVISRAAPHTGQLLDVTLPRFDRTTAEREEDARKRTGRSR